MINKKILILFAHPAFQKSRSNHQLVESIKNMEGITFHNLYDQYPDFHIDVTKEKDLLLDHDIIIWHHPFYWYSAPAILKEWIDLVLQHGFAYGRKGTALKGKQVMTVITTGGSRDAYQDGGFNQHKIRQYLIPFERTVTLCNMDYLPPFVVHGTHLITEDDLDQYAVDYKKILVSLRDDIFDLEDMMEHEYMNDLLQLNKKGY